jgi:hypothetical protein
MTVTRALKGLNMSEAWDSRAEFARLARICNRSWPLDVAYSLLG